VTCEASKNFRWHIPQRKDMSSYLANTETHLVLRAFVRIASNSWNALYMPGVMSACCWASSRADRGCMHAAGTSGFLNPFQFCVALIFMTLTQ
jgi:hypothetical protein